MDELQAVSLFGQVYVCWYVVGAKKDYPPEWDYSQRHQALYERFQQLEPKEFPKWVEYAETDLSEYQAKVPKKTTLLPNRDAYALRACSQHYSEDPGEFEPFLVCSCSAASFAWSALFESRAACRVFHPFVEVLALCVFLEKDKQSMVIIGGLPLRTVKAARSVKIVNVPPKEDHAEVAASSLSVNEAATNADRKMLVKGDEPR